MDKSLLWKAAATLASIGAAMAARNTAAGMWRRQRGSDPPANPADPATGWGEAIAWTIFVGALVGLSRLVARRSAAGIWRSADGALPPALQEVES